MKVLERIKNPFRREAYINFHVTHSEVDGQLVKMYDGFSIIVCSKGKCQTHFGEIEIEEANQIVNALMCSKGKLELQINGGMAWSTIVIPKWAKKQLIKEIKGEVNESK